MFYSLLISWLSIGVGLNLPKTAISLRFWSLKIGGRTKTAKNDSLGTILFNLKEAGPFS